MKPGSVIEISEHEARVSLCPCEVATFASGEAILIVRYGCREHCPAPPEPIVNAVQFFGSALSVGVTLKAVDRHDPRIAYSVTLAGKEAERWAEEFQLDSQEAREKASAFVAGYLSGYRRGRG